MNHYSLRIIEPKDLGSVVEIHKKSFPDSLLTMLENRTIERYYEWQMGVPNQCHAVGCYEDEMMVGFCFAGVFRDSEIGFLKRNWRLILKQLIIHPELLKQKIVLKRALFLISAMFNQVIPKKQSSDYVNSKKFGVLSIAVDPKYQGLKIGKELIQESESFARQSKFTIMRLSVHIDNIQAIHFYENQGWMKKLDESGKWTGLMEKALI